MKRLILIVLISVGAVVVVLAILEAAGTIHLFSNANTNQPTSSGNQYTKGIPKTNNGGSSSQLNNSSGGNSSGQQNGPASKLGSPNAATLIAPTGNYVSNHGLNGSSVTYNSQESSSCSTTPGATCQITFTQNGAQPKQLPAEQTDEGGITYWNNWTPASIGLTSGSWQIEAIATLNGQTKTATDALDLVVSP
jgi:hypothetical protein